MVEHRRFNSARQAAKSNESARLQNEIILQDAKDCIQETEEINGILADKLLELGFELDYDVAQDHPPAPFVRKIPNKKDGPNLPSTIDLFGPMSTSPTQP